MESLKISNKADYKNFVQMLNLLPQKDRVNDLERHTAILNSKHLVLGICMSSLKKIAKSILLGEPKQFLELCESNSYEEMLIEGLVIAGVSDLDWQHQLVQGYIKKIDCWSLCDCTVSAMHKLKASGNKSKFFSFYKNLCYHESEFEARFGLVCLMVNFLQPEFIDEILSAAREVKSEKYYIQMAVAWLVSEAYVKFKPQAEDLLKSKCLPRTIQNLAIKKCLESFRVSLEDKQKLRTLKM